jgi:hypothetical protein
MELGATKTFAGQAQSLYDENLTAYIKLLFRRQLAKLMVSKEYQRSGEPLAHPLLFSGLLRWCRAAGPELGQPKCELELQQVVAEEGHQGVQYKRYAKAYRRHVQACREALY